MNFILNHLYIFLSIFFAVASQLIIKWKMSAVSLQESMTLIDKFGFAFSMLFNPWIMLSIIFTLLSGLSWMIAMTKFEISYAYPFTALGYLFILLLSAILFHESLNWYKIAGVLCIMAGIVITTKGT